MGNIHTYILIGLMIAITARIMLGPTIWDRLLAINLLSSKLIMLTIIYAFARQLPYILDIALVTTIVGFVGVVFISLFVEGQRRKS